jgi:hypothetical protein
LLELADKGVSVFFDHTGKVSTIRLNAPFAGAIGGVRIKDPREALIQARGEPLRQWKLGPHQAHLYALDGRTRVRYDVRNGTVETIFLLPSTL